MNNIIAKVCFAIYIIVLVRSGFSPIDYEVRKIEAITSAICPVILLFMYLRGIKFSPLAYILMAIFPIMHAIGAHYTFANVPSQRLSDLLHTDRNMYDRIAHASVWLYAYGIIQYIDMKNITKSIWLKVSYAIFAIMALALTYELFERRYAVSSDPSAGIAVLWSQGDIRDAQKDMLMDTTWAIIWAIAYMIWSRSSK